MTALLDWNGRSTEAPQPPIRLRSRGKPVASEWLLIVVEDVLKKWRVIPRLAVSFETRQLVGILSLESIASAVGPGEGRRVAKEIACSAIDKWTF